jgi:hypothetical protein
MFDARKSTLPTSAELMIPRFLTRAEWEAKLRRWGCEPLSGVGPLNTAEWWKRPEGGIPFTVPAEEDGSCDFWAIQRLASDFGRPPPARPFKA